METIILMVVGLGFFAGCIAFMIALSGELRPIPPAPPVAHDHAGDHCALCNAPLPRLGATRDEVVRALERRIDHELSVVTAALASPEREDLARLYVRG